MKRHLIGFPIVTLIAAMAASVPQLHAHGFHAGMDASRQASASDRFIVTYRQGSSEVRDQGAALQNVSAAVSRSGLDKAVFKDLGLGIRRLYASYVRKLAAGGDLIGVSHSLDDVQARKLMRAIAADPAVLHVERDIRLHALDGSRLAAEVSPRGMSSHHVFPMARWNYGDPRGGANVEKAWELADGKDVVVAVLDTGITQHPGLDLSLADAGYDFTRDPLTSGRDEYGRAAGGWDPGDWSNTPEYEDCFDEPGGEASTWQGTRAAGIVAGLAGGPTGNLGIAYRAKVLPVRVAGHCGAGYLSDITDAIVWAAGGRVRGVPDNKHPAQVITLGVGDRFEDGCTETFSLKSAIAEARLRGAVVIAPAGDFGGDVDLAVPASCPGVIAVAANGIRGGRAGNSSFGSGVALAAPGGGEAADGSAKDLIWSLSNEGATVPADPGYGGSSGTALAAAHVAGAAALVIGAVKQAGLPALDAEQVGKVLVDTARAFPVAPDRPIGAGILDAYAAVMKALGSAAPAESVIPLERGVLRSEPSIAQDQSLLYAITVPAGARHLHLRTLGGKGDATLYLKSGLAPAVDGANADATSDHAGNNEAIAISRPQPGTWYLRVRAKQAASHLSVQGSYAL
ncbi:serine protease [Dyella sp. SG562]|uniref:S8 family serine peptidase n=1 Tax=Dyella sp. SG562 TaxID=2587017 RepID=UPI001420FF79|nr:S8 family serine peptidase [Dyella sp. SG562]NII74625.1 serine protease [Dyella sp. SG562]